MNNEFSTSGLPSAERTESEIILSSPTRNEQFYQLCEKLLLPSQVTFPMISYSKRNNKYEIVQLYQIWGLWRDKIHHKV